MPDTSFLLVTLTLTLTLNLNLTLNLTLTLTLYLTLTLTLTPTLTLTLTVHRIPSDQGTYEQYLVRTFIEAAKQYGNKAHISRAIALEGTMFQNLGNFDNAVLSQLELEK